nr:gibberellin 2-beta-dioxygenase 8-like isoform X2 [Arachis hypogaea]
MDYEPPFLETYKTLLQEEDSNRNNDLLLVENFDDEIELPLIDLNRLNENNLDERDECMEEISDAARRWGFFQIVNHGISKDLLDISMMDNQHKSLRWNIEAFEAAVTPLAQCLAEILACKMNMIMKSKNYFKENCFQKSSIIRLNRYPPCPKLLSSKLYGLMPHNDSSFISIVYQDHVGGLELLKDGKWIHVKPNPGALVINIGDLFQALSNGIYKSIKHRVVVSQKEERYSVAFFYCPLLETLIQSHSHTKPAMYKNFTFREYREQNEKAVKQTGDKIGLSKFLL